MIHAREYLNYNRGQAWLSILILDFGNARRYFQRNKNIRRMERLIERRDSVN